MTPLISVVVPVYKAKNCLDELYSRLVSSLEIVSKNFEIILVEDCGQDGSWEKIEEMSLYDKRVKGFQFSRNFGQHYGITAGLDHAEGDWIVVMDCDLQDRPEEIPRLYEKALEGFDIVLALRGKRKDPLVKRITSEIFYKFFSYLADVKFDGDSGNFRIMSRQAVDSFRDMREKLRFFGALVSWMGFKTTSIQAQHSSRYDGKSSYTYRALFKLASETIIAYSDKPLRLSIRFGFLMSFLSLIYGIYVLTYSWLNGVTVPGWTSLIVSLYLIGGVIIFNLGIIGVYVGKTFDESKKRPLYIIGKRTHQK
ncbi:glycosyltransferase family 2 protein [Salinivibrio proteolyticus]|uniref:Glycosyltransferase family 2 protein n=1 Tax=Salinivibrio proteolyticus TaxID=334715 RepID=A0ABY7L9N8_9GAMM|nr:glycosyltransferase family 2 protein [Salinivibrio proteolyticus]WBA13969.1 glycosyltransferase family 2 protein [Salinivibrio proteolyticus]